MNQQHIEQPTTNAVIVTTNDIQYSYSALLFILIPIIIVSYLINDKIEFFSDIFYYLRHPEDLNDDN